MENVCKNCKWVNVNEFKSPGSGEVTEKFRCFYKPIPVPKQPEDFCSFFESKKVAAIEPVKVEEVIKEQETSMKNTKTKVKK